jgi:hypothetical protein
LLLPILALAYNEPEDEVRGFLACLQTGSGQTFLARRFLPWEEMHDPGIFRHPPREGQDEND